MGHSRLYSLYGFVLFFFSSFFLFLSLFTSKMECFCFMYSIHLYISYIYIHIHTHLYLKEFCGYLHIDARTLFYKSGVLNSYRSYLSETLVLSRFCFGDAFM